MALLLLGLVLACYWPALHGALLWDDAGHVTRPDLRPLSGLARIWTDVHATQQYYPVLHTAFWIEHRLWGDSTLGYHLLNVLLHAASCCVLALLLRRLWSEPAPRTVPAGTEWLAALLFAVHPVCAESVAWISEQKNTLSLLLYLLAGWAYLDFSAARRPRSYGLASALFLLALGTKSVTATLPAALLVVLWWRNGALSWRRDVPPLLPWFAVAIVSGLFTAWVERKLIGAEGVGFELSLVQRVLLAGRVIWFYAGTLAWPLGQAFFYDRWDVAASSGRWIGALAATLGVTAALWALRGRARGPLAGWLLFIGSLFPALGFFNVYPFVFSYVADHFQYLASMSLVATVVAAAAVGLAGSSPRVRGAARALAALLIVTLAVLSNLQSRLYVSDETLFRATLARSPTSWMAHHILGFALAMSGDRQAEAITEYREALRLNPDYPDAHIGLAIELARLPGREAEAIEHYERALALKPQAADAQNDLGLVLSGIPGRVDEAIGHYEEALRLKPDFAEAHANLANALAGKPARLSEALGHFEAALRLEPGSPEMHELYAEALARSPGRTSEAQAHYEEALRLRPDYAQAHAGLASVLEGLPGRAPEAIEHYEAALRINPGIAWAQLALALQLSSVPGREAEATLHAEEALRLRPGYAEAHNCLAILCAQAGRLSEARSHWERALQLDPNYQTARDNLRLLDRMGPGHPGNP
jgi:tetratricopeptide (TPR) repeat protein